MSFTEEPEKNDRIAILCPCDSCMSNLGHVKSFLSFYRMSPKGFYREVPIVELYLSSRGQIDDGDYIHLEEFLTQKFADSNYDVFFMGFRGCKYWNDEDSHISLLLDLRAKISSSMDSIMTVKPKKVSIRFFYGIPLYKGNFVEFEEKR